MYETVSKVAANRFRLPYFADSLGIRQRQYQWAHNGKWSMQHPV